MKKLLQRYIKLQILKKVIAMVLLVVIGLSDLATTVVYAQSMTTDPTNQEIEKVEISTLMTDTEKAPDMPFIGEGRGVKSVIPAMADFASANTSAGFVVPARVRKLAKENYRPNEEIAVVIENGVGKEYETTLIDAVGNKVAVNTDEVETGAAKVLMIEQPSSFRPGKYTLQITDDQGGSSAQDFTWGVLAVNPDKSIYLPNETANLAIGVLDEGGNMVCDAQVELQITDPNGKMNSLSTDNEKIIINEECKSHDFTLKPDYETNYKVGGAGVYKMLLKAQTKNGAYSISDAFEVRNSVPFDVKRVTATRIYPPNAYPVTMEIISNQDFEGTITETVPASFRIAPQGSEIVTENQKIEDVIARSDPASQENDEAISNTDDTTGIAASSSTPRNDEVKAPDNLPKAVTIASSGVLPYNTINNIQDSLGGPQVLGASIPGIGMPFSGPFPISQEFGESLVTDKHDHGLYESFGMEGHDGMDFAMPEGTPILAVDSGKVLFAGEGDYGITVVIEHSWGRSYYGHLSSVAVKEGQDVSRGTSIAASGNTGISTGPHLHFGIKPKDPNSENGFYGKVDPAYYLGLKSSAGQVLGVAASVDATLASVPQSSQTSETIPNAPDTDVKVLTWKVNVKKGDTISIGYSYLAPRISPQFYTLGPATFTDTAGKEVFHETRKWQIASDALEYKFKRGSFTKSTCTTPCTQSVAGVGFKGKAVIFEWTLQTTAGISTDSATNGQHMGTGFATSSSQERSVEIYSEDKAATSDACRIRSDTKVIVMMTTDCSTGTTLAEADFVSFDTDGFTLNWSTNDANQYIIHYTVLGGADVSNAKAGTFTLTTGSVAELAVTDPGFQPDFVMALATGTEAVNTKTATAKMSVGYAASGAKQATLTNLIEDNSATSDSCSRQRDDVFLFLYDPDGTGTATCAAQDALIYFTKFDSTGFTLNKSDAPASNTDIFYLALQGGMYDVGNITQPTAAGESTTTIGFRPTGVSLASTGTSTTGLTGGSALSFGGASRADSEAWCTDTTGVSCTSDWTQRKVVTFNNSASSENLTNFPVLVKLNSSRIDYSKTQNSGQDIRFVDPSDPGTVLSHEIESWNESGDSFVWVKVPQIDAGSRTDGIYMYYGNAAASDGQDIVGVWDSSFKAVYHMDEPSGTTNADSTGNANNGTKRSATEPNPTTTGPIGPAQDFDNTNDYVRASDSNSLDLVSNGTISVWFNRDVTANWDSLVAKTDVNAANGTNYSLEINNSNRIELIVATASTNQVHTNLTDITSTTNNYYAAATWDSSTLWHYLNGASDGSTAQTVIPAANTATLRIGEFGGSVDYYDGHIDEVRISNVTRSADWVEAEYLSGNDAMNTFGTAETYGVGAQTMSEGSIWGSDTDSQATEENANMATSTTKAIQLITNPAQPNSPTAAAAEADMQSFDPNGFTLNWTTADATARNVVYWAVGSVTASQEDYRWYKNTNAITPTAGLEDENSATVLAKNKPYARLRASVSAGGNGLNASTQGYKLQYAAAGAEAAVGGVNDWCNDTTGVTCTAPVQGEVSADTVTDWCNDTTGVSCTTDWSARRKVTFNNSIASAAVTNFPVLIKLDSTRINYSKTQNSGQDIRFVDPSDPTVVLDHEIEVWDEGGTSYVWVEVPQIDAQSTTDSIWMYYGNSSVGDGQNVSGTWNSSYSIVYHMDEPSGNLSDSAGTAQDATRGGTSVTQTTGKVGSAQDFSSTGYTSTANPSLPTGNFTYETWVYLDSNGDETIFMSSDGAAGAVSEVRLYTNTGGAEVTVDGTGTPIADFTPATGAWHHIMVSRASGTITFYKDGIATPNTLTDASTLDFLLDSDGVTQCELFLGTDVDANCNGTLGNYLDGRIDEFRVSSTNRSASWALISYKNQNDQFNSYSSEFTQNETKQQSSGWGYRKKITFDNASSSAALVDFPVLVKLDSSKIDYSKTQDDGGDIRFVDPADRTTVLSHEIESWNENGTSHVWVKVPQIDSGSTTDYMYMYYGNSGVSDGQNATGVWDSSTVMVHHLEEAAGCTSFSDSTTNAHNGTCLSAPAINTSSKIGSGRTFDSVDDGISIPDNASFDPGSGAQTIEAWVKPISFNNEYHNILDHAGTGGWAFYLDGTTPYSTCNVAGELCYYENSGDQGSGTAIPTATWSHVAAVKSGTNVTFYVNGIASGSITISNPINESGSIVIGLSNFTTGGFNGTIDEVRYSSTNRSADWMEATYLTGNDMMNSFGQEQAYTLGGTATAGWTDVGDVWCNDASGVVCNTSWAYRKRITINNQSSSTALTNFPVLVKLDSTRIDYTKTQDDGDDIRFVDPADPSTVLSHEIESWNESGESFVWVEVPTLDAKSTSDSIWLYYGNASVGSGQDATGVWDSNFQFVQHLKEDPSASAPQMQDSTTNNRDGTSIGSMTATDLVSAKINGGLDFDGTNDNISISDFYIQNQVTVSAWVWRHPQDSDSKLWANAISKWTGDAVNDEWVIGMDEGMYSFWIETANNRVALDTTIPIPKSEWVYMTMTYDGATVRGYVNGVEIVSQAATGTIDNSTQPVLIGRNAGFSYWQGKIDEGRVSDTARSANWIRAEYLSGADQINTFGNEETQSSAVWKFKDNSGVSNGATITSSVLGTSTTGNQMTYQEANPTTLNPTAVAVGEKREFDFSLDGSLASNRRTYYFRIVAADGTPLTNYSKYPSITIGVPNQKVMRGGKFFNYKQAQPFSF